MLKGLSSFFRCIGTKDPSQLSCRRRDELSNLGSRGLYKADQLGAQFVERRQRSQRLDAINVQNSVTHRTADNFQFVVGFGEFDCNLGGGNRIDPMWQAQSARSAGR